MLLRIALFALMATGLLGFGAVAWFSTMPAPPPPEAKVAEALPAPPPAPVPPPPPAKVTVTVAARTLRAGSFLRPDDLRAQEMDAAAAPPGALTDSPAVRGQLNGSMLRRGVGEGEALAGADVFKPTDRGFLAAVLEPGMRAETVALADPDSSPGFLWPGDRVDLILTQQFADPDIKLRRRFAGETVLQDIRVVAVDQQMMPGETPPDTDGKPQAMHRIAVEVPPDAAERLAVAARLGKLTVSLRAASEEEPRAPARNPAGKHVRLLPASAWEQPDPEPRGVTWSGTVSRALNLPVRPAPPPRVELFRGNADGGGHG